MIKLCPLELLLDSDEKSPTYGSSSEFEMGESLLKLAKIKVEDGSDEEADIIFDLMKSASIEVSKKLIAQYGPSLEGLKPVIIKKYNYLYSGMKDEDEINEIIDFAIKKIKRLSKRKG